MSNVEEEDLFCPNPMDQQASLFYKKLGEDAAKSRASLDVVVPSLSLKPSLGQYNGAQMSSSNVREIFDVAHWLSCAMCHVVGRKARG